MIVALAFVWQLLRLVQGPARRPAHPAELAVEHAAGQLMIALLPAVSSRATRMVAVGHVEHWVIQRLDPGAALEVHVGEGSAMHAVLKLRLDHRVWRGERSSGAVARCVPLINPIGVRTGVRLGCAPSPERWSLQRITDEPVGVSQYGWADATALGLSAALTRSDLSCAPDEQRTPGQAVELCVLNSLAISGAVKVLAFGSGENRAS
jgi:hypothetical protein